MAGVKGRSGTNKGQDKPWREAIMLAVKESDGDAHKLRKLARALVTAGIAGDVSALREIGDRLDGKPKQEIDQVIERRYVARLPEPAADTGEWLKQHAPKPNTIQ